MRYRKRMTRLAAALACAATLSIPARADRRPSSFVGDLESDRQSPALHVRAQASSAGQRSSPRNPTLTAVDGIKVGSYTLPGGPTGCTVILVDGEARPAASSQRGGAPGTRETDLLNPLNMVDKVNAVVLSGGSAFGLDAATGTVKWLEEHNIGWDARRRRRCRSCRRRSCSTCRSATTRRIIPAPTAATRRSRRRPTAPVPMGTVGAGAGATVGKMGGPGRSMKGGLGSAALRMPNGLVVAAIVAVNAVGDIIDPDTGKVVAGVRNPDGTLRRRAHDCSAAAR